MSLLVKLGAFLKGVRSFIMIPRQQAVIRRSAALVQNQWYDLWTGGAVAAGAGSIIRNVRIILISLDQAVANETIELRIIADGIDETCSQIAVAGNNYTIVKDESPDAPTLFGWIAAASYAMSMSFSFEVRACRIMYRKTTAAGANATTIKCIYALW